MRTLIELTPPGGVFLSGQPATQPVSEAIDVAAYDLIELEIAVVYYTGPTSPPPGGFTYIIDTSMQSQLDDSSWVPCVAPIALNGAGTQRFSLDGSFLRYIRWRLYNVDPTTKAVVFLKGIASSYV